RRRIITLADSPKGRAAFWNPKVNYWNVPLMRNERIVERPADQTTITRRYTEEAIAFIRAHRSEPFFIYLAHNMPHVPLFRSKRFAGRSLRGLYGDVVEEIDWGVGEILQTLRELKLDRQTIVWFTSDNGPWLIFDELGGSAGLLRDGKGSTWEGGMREPGIVWWPGRIPAGVVTRELATTMDIYTTSLKLAGAEVPKDRVVDGLDLRPLLFGQGESPRQTVYYYRGRRLMAIRHGPWKAHFITQPAYGRAKPTYHDPPVLYHLEHDPSEKYNVADKHPDVIAQLKRLAEMHRATVHAPPSQLEIRLGSPR
ncbi:MAG TPA: arylsulfatase, partial [Planctomycetaceae bacterium]|nr:arylsulfatase [Planctomycetaceae bacterium]